MLIKISSFNKIFTLFFTKLIYSVNLIIDKRAIFNNHFSPLLFFIALYKLIIFYSKMSFSQKTSNKSFENDGKKTKYIIFYKII